MALHESRVASAVNAAEFVAALCALTILVSVLSLGGALMAQSDTGTLTVSIDVKPGEEPTTIEPKRDGMIPVAILSTPEFEAARVDPSTARVGATGTEASVFRSAAEDLDNDGDTDLLLLFRVKDMKLECGIEALLLKGKTLDGQKFEGKEAVTMTGCG